MGLKLEQDDIRTWLQDMKIQSIHTNSNRVAKGQNWGIFDFCNQFLQTEEQLKAATCDLCQRLSEKNVIYAEIRFCPDLHTLSGLNSEQALKAVIEGSTYIHYY